MSLARFAKKRDTAEGPILEALARINAKVVPLDWLDLLVGWGGRWTVLEVKTGRARLQPHQEREIKECQRRGLPVAVVRTPEEALQAVGATR